MDPVAILWTEGKTDSQHLKKAFQVLGVGVGITFKEVEGSFGDDRLLKQCMAFSLQAQPRPTIFVFDRDNHEIVRKVEDANLGYKAWGNNVYSFAIPTPPHRTGLPVSIELYYSDDELRTLDTNGRRLFLSSEFNPVSGRHISDATLSIANKLKLGSGKHLQLRIIDSQVYNLQSQNVALSKADFAEKVFAGEEAFANFDFESFRSIRNVIADILQASQGKINLPFGDLDTFLTSIDTLDKQQQFGSTVRAMIRACKLLAMTFIAASLRYYEQRIIDESTADVRKVRPIKEVLAQSFAYPSLRTLQKLCRHCYHLVDESAPSEIFITRGILAATPVLGAVGDLLDDLERIFPESRDKVRFVDKYRLRKPIMDFVLLEFARYEGRMSELAEPRFDELLKVENVTKWRSALLTLLEWFAPLQSLPFRIRTIERVRNDSDEFDVLITTYRDQAVSVEQTSQTYGDLDDNRMETYELVVSIGGEERGLDLFPFIIIRNDKMHYYRRTRARGYEYNVVLGLEGYLENSKRKFSQTALRTKISNDLQNLFWTHVTPTVSDLGVRANFPAHGVLVGRKQQITTIMEEIIQIPNENGIVYGPGGVGKTTLLIELSRQLFEEPTSTAPFKNIIWVSAKADYYDPTLDIVEAGQPQFRSLDNVLGAILEFHEFEDAQSYSLDEKKWLVLESLRDEKTLLVLDNFETVAETGQKDILKFFGVTVKQNLRDKPEHFKVLITSRKLIPSGFHQVNLKGLDDQESKQLMARLYEPYARSGKQQRTEKEISEIYEATQGIPLIIKHCYGQIYEYNRELNLVLAGLSRAGTKVVNFSFTEVFELLKQDELQLKTIMLLELSGRRLMTRQIADILQIHESDVAERLAQLVNYQCVNVTSVGNEEKYGINDEVRFLTRRLTIEHSALAVEIKTQIANLALDKRMDYTQKEFDAVLSFEDYIAQGHYVLAENFMNERLKDHASSLLLNLHYAKYLKEIKRRTNEAIERLEKILVRSGYDQQVLRLLMEYYVALEIPNYEQAHIYARELEDISTKNADIKYELAQFYVAWSTAMKMKVELDPLKEKVRQQTYKELADTAIRLLRDVNLGTHEWHYFLAQSFFNRWDTASALKSIDKAIGKLPADSHLTPPYRRLRGEIQWRRRLDEELRQARADANYR